MRRPTAHRFFASVRRSANTASTQNIMSTIAMRCRRQGNNISSPQVSPLRSPKPTLHREGPIQALPKTSSRRGNPVRQDNPRRTVHSEKSLIFSSPTPCKWSRRTISNTKPSPQGHNNGQRSLVSIHFWRSGVYPSGIYSPLLTCNVPVSCFRNLF